MTTVTRVFSSVLLALGLAATAAACKDKSVLGDGGRETMGAYAAGYNEIIGRVPDFLKNYGNAVGADGPTAESLSGNQSWMCSGIWLDLKKVDTAFSTAKSSAGKELSHLAALADELHTAVKDIDSHRAALCKYLDAEDYKDDDLKLAKELDEKIRDAAGRYTKSVNAMSVALDEIEDKQVLADIAKHEGKKNASYWYRHFSHQSKLLLKAAEREPANFPEAHDAWLSHYQGLEKFTAEHGSKVNASFKSYQSTADRFAAAAKKLRRSVEEAGTDEEKAAAAGEGFDGLVSSYNTLLAFHEGFASLEEYGKLEE